MHRQNLYPVILTDIMMPKIDGVEFIRQVKTAHPTCIPFVMTAYASMTNLIECLEIGVVDYFTKPFESLDFVVKTILDEVERHQRWTKYLAHISRKG